MPELQRWQVIIHRRAEKVLRRLDGELLDRLRQAIRKLAPDPRPVGTVKLAGTENLYRIRVGDWRIIYAIEDDRLIVLMLEIAPRGEVYRNLP